MREKAKRSHLETIFRRDKSNAANKHLFHQQSHLVSRLITKAKRSYFRNMITSNKNSPKQLWQTMNNLLSRNAPKVLPESQSSSSLANSFLKFFDNKITKLCSTIPSNFSSFLIVLHLTLIFLAALNLIYAPKLKFVSSYSPLPMLPALLISFPQSLLSPVLITGSTYNSPN